MGRAFGFAQFLGQFPQHRRIAIDRPDRLAVYSYAHVPWLKKPQRVLAAHLPEGTEKFAIFVSGIERFSEAGYVYIGMDHFALPHDEIARAQEDRTLWRNFQGYTTDTAPYLLGFGASAIGRTPHGYMQNEADERRWLAAVQAGRLPIARGRALSEEDRLRGALIERVMCDAASALDAIPPAVLADAAPRIDGLLADRLLRRADGRLAVTEAGRPFLRHFAACFDAFLAPAAGRHSAAV